MVSQDLKETENSLQGGSLLRSALDYASMGIYILPAEPNGKRLLQKTRYKKPSTSIEIIKYWWSVEPNANIAIPLSVRNNALIVVDLDVSGIVSGQASIAEYLDKSGQTLPETLSVITGSGGHHLYFKNNKRVAHRGCQHILPCVDIRAEDAYTIAPPSIHRNGNKYAVEVGSFCDISDANDTVYHLLEMCKSPLQK